MSDAKVKKLADLSLLLLFLGGWEEESRQFPGEKVFRAWKGFLFTTLNDLCENNFLTRFKRENRGCPSNSSKPRKQAK